MRLFLRLAPLAILLSFFFLFCQKERFTFSPEAALEFSTDTLRFDTVFTQLGSATRYFKVYNRHNKSIGIASISLENGSDSLFNLNSDGVSGNRQRDIEIAPNDSLYVFAEVTINPNNQDNPNISDYPDSPNSPEDPNDPDDPDEAHNEDDSNFLDGPTQPR